MPRTTSEALPARRGSLAAAAAATSGAQGHIDSPIQPGRPDRARAADVRSPATGTLRLILLFSIALLVFVPNAFADDPFLRHTATVDAVKKVGPSVVNITTERVTKASSPFRRRRASDPLSDEFFNNLFEPRERTVQSLGSGVIFDADGHVLTNEHVIARADRVRVSIADGREFDAELVGADPTNDLAVLRIVTDEALPFTPPGESSDLMVGEPVIAIGNPFGYSNSVTTGVVSAKNRSINADSQTFHGLIQTDALINPGNSGGPLLNAVGDLIGINSAIYGPAQGIGFAISIDTAKRVIRELLLFGEVHPVWLGLEFQDLDPALREVMGLPSEISGALINRLHPASPAARAGVERGDIVAKLDDRRVANAQDLFNMLEGMTDGQPIELALYRDGALIEATPIAEELPPAMVRTIAHRKLGLDLEHSPAKQAFEVVRVDRGSPAAQLGLRKGDFMLGINGVVLASDEDLRRAVARLRGRGRALVVVQRGPGRYHLTIPLI